VNGDLLKKMFVCGANELTRHSRELDALNVFPVPDGDTGINMSHTVQSAAREAAKITTNHAYDVAKAASSGALRGARGNSGVILSQLFRGFAKGLEGVQQATSQDLTRALEESAAMAYRAVMKPKEGTILTVAKALGEGANKALETAADPGDIIAGLGAVIAHGNQVLAKTQEMLPELKQAGVVDSGGKGLMYFVEGALQGIHATEDPALLTSAGEESAPLAGGPAGVGASALSTADIPFPYCTEFLIEAGGIPAVRLEAECGKLERFLCGLGDSVVVVGDDGVVKVHVHTDHPGLALERALKLGQLVNIKIDNMRVQHDALGDMPAPVASVPAGPKKDVGVVSVVAGAGLTALFKELGADVVIEGGQTMNPSAEDIANAIKEVNAHHVVVLPNNKNIILAAEQAALLVPDDVQVHIVPTKFVTQGARCLMDFMNLENPSPDDLVAVMEDSLQAVQTGQITYAVRNTMVDGNEVQEGDILCLYNGKIVLTGKSLYSAARELVDYMLAQGPSEFVTIYYGEGVPEDEAAALSQYTQEKGPEADMYNGQQPLYYYIISVE